LKWYRSLYNKLLFLLKNIYQTFLVKVTLNFYRVFTPKTDQILLAKKRLQKRNFELIDLAPTKVLAIFSINNWEKQLLNPLKLLGKVHHFSWPNIKNFYSSRSEWEVVYDKINSDIKSTFDSLYDKESNIIIFLYASDFVISKKTMKLFQNSNTLIISFCWDDLLYFKGMMKGQPVGVSQLSTEADINLTFSPEVIPQYNFFKSPCFFWSSIPKTILNEQPLNYNIHTNFYVLFIGSKYGHREVFVHKLIKKGIPVKCFGSGWSNGNISETQMHMEIANAPVTLGFSNVGYTRNITTIKGRDFEVPLLGGLYLTQFSKGLELYYKPGKEILTYMNFENCISQITWIQENPKDAFQIRLAGYLKALQNCTWEARMEYLKQIISLTTSELPIIKPN